MVSKRQKLGFLIIFFMGAVSKTSTTSTDLENSLNDLYESLLHREYVGPIPFADHQVERKAQRSPSLRLRFGRSNGGSSHIENNIQKRWIGDVNQKPIRSPSLRLRFGKRSNQFMDENRNDIYNAFADDQYMEREERKPSGRLRWGRGSSGEQEDDNSLEALNDENFDPRNFYDKNSLAFLSYLAILRNMNDDLTNGYERTIRKTGMPLRLRWGRSAYNTPETEDNNIPKKDASAKTSIN